MSAKFIGAIDQGTSSTRFVIMNHEGSIVASDQIEINQFYPQPGYVEHDALDIWAKTQQVMTNALAKASLTPSDLVGVGITNQRETTVIWNKDTGEPYHHALVWNDGRTAELAAQWCAKLGGQDVLRPVCGLPIASYFSVLKMLWLFDNVPGLKEAAEAGDAIFGTIDSWLVWNLTRDISPGATPAPIHITEPTNACRTMLFNISELKWDDGQIELFGIPKQMLPEVRTSSEVYGVCAPCTPLAGVKIAAILGDQNAALFGQCCFQTGQLKSTYGTGCFMLMNVGTKPVPSNSGLLSTMGYHLKGQPAVYALEGAVQVSGSLIQWLRDQLDVLDDAKDSEALALSVEDNGGVYFVPAFAGLFAPHWREDARGVICGLTAFNSKAHVVRAGLEASAFQAQELFEAMEADSGVKLSSINVDGGMTANGLFMQFHADMARVRINRPKYLETTAMGAAYCAGLAVGFWQDMDELQAKWAVDASWEPKMDLATRNKQFGFWKKAVARSKGWLLDDGKE
eukprot:CAMPEP_0119503910 /NCGR_PEP_ID=MMETSP1344-20130328/24928_1 /TAXON_ID=236787 /ORGANISM="Florenciella parvula, Strain CCMP2471" /LENGTH=512 /DNA_ID=CAMNT_0007540241 /DNA_START=66 /DNA_END=1601 /DNA_ORIENTATION=-